MEFSRKDKKKSGLIFHFAQYDHRTAVLQKQSGAPTTCYAALAAYYALLIPFYNSLSAFWIEYDFEDDIGNDKRNSVKNGVERFAEYGSGYKVEDEKFHTQGYDNGKQVEDTLYSVIESFSDTLRHKEAEENQNEV